MLKRYGREELLNVLKDIFYEHFATSDSIFYQDKVRSTGSSIPKILYDEKHKLMKDIKDRIQFFAYEKKDATEEDANLYAQGMKLLQTEYDRLEMNSSIKKQKINYKKTKDVYSTHTYLEVPLNKKINALYDGFTLQVLFFDDLSNSEGLINTLESIENINEKIQFVKDHTEITHMSLQATERSRCIISVLGKFNNAFTNPENVNCVILPPEYSDFANLRLLDCERIRNNDLKQIIQERIDMDREDLKLLADRNVRGDNYQILKHNSDLYIRYICPSTQRVYYNLLNTDYLARSQYFKERNYNSYILSWYSINNLFMELTDEVLNEKATRC